MAFLAPADVAQLLRLVQLKWQRVDGMREDAAALSLLHGLTRLTCLTAECVDCQLPRRAAWPRVLEQTECIERVHVG